MANITDSIKTVLPESNKDIIIEDPVLEPYFIVNYAEGGWGVCMKRLSQKGELKYKDVCYPARFVSCLDTVAKAKMQDTGKHYISIQEYIQDWKQVSDRVLDACKVWNVPEI